MEWIPSSPFPFKPHILIWLPHLPGLWKMPDISKGAFQFAKHIHILVALSLHNHFVWDISDYPHLIGEETEALQSQAVCLQIHKWKVTKQVPPPHRPSQEAVV